MGSRGDFDSYIWPSDGVEPLTEAGTKRPVVNCAADLQHQVGASPRPAHLLRLVHPAIDQEIRRAFRHRSPNAHAGAVSSGVVDKPGALATEIFVDLVKRIPQFSGCHASGSMTALTLVEMHDLADAIEGLLGILALPFQMRQCSRSTSVTIVALASLRPGSSVSNPRAAGFACCSRMAMWNQICDRPRAVTPASARIDRSPGTAVGERRHLWWQRFRRLPRGSGESEPCNVGVLDLATAPKTCRPPSDVSTVANTNFQNAGYLPRSYE